MTAKPAHLFLCLENGQYAVSHDADGSNLPRGECRSGWKYIRTFALGAQDPLPFQANPEPILRALSDKGYWVMADDGLPHGTSQ